MKLYGYADVDWEPLGFSFGIPDDFVGHPSVEPTILPRPGTYATFGMNVVGEMTIPCELFFNGDGTLGAMEYEDAFAYIFKRLDPINPAARQLRAERNSGALVHIPAVIRVPTFGSGEINSRILQFVAVQPYWESLTASSGSGTF